jgi:hypothetical protein
MRCAEHRVLLLSLSNKAHMAPNPGFSNSNSQLNPFYLALALAAGVFTTC